MMRPNPKTSRNSVTKMKRMAGWGRGMRQAQCRGSSGNQKLAVLILSDRTMRVSRVMWREAAPAGIRCTAAAIYSFV